MTEMFDNNQLPQYASVRTVHILETGELIYSLQEYEKVKDRFSWVDKSFILSEILRLRRLTENGRQSIIAIYEAGNQIKAFLNLENDFHPRDFQLKRETPET